ncbi:MAG: ExbD/TolR family protein [Bdellovibrionaceae bacterium]|nr:ExbD/TolR family protein [Pseudobdellovibrionaceae bacterium]
MGMSGGNQGSKKSRMTISEINVTPLVDVMLVLLIMFMVTAPMMQQGIDVDLPKTAASGVAASQEPMVLVISADRKLSIAKRNIPSDQLRARLTGIFETRKDKALYIQADRRVDYGFVAETMAEVRAAGITNVGLITLPRNQ